MDTKLSLGINCYSYAGIAALVLSAALFDLRTRRIPNPLILAGACLGLILSTWAAGAAGASSSLLGLLTGFALFLPGYLLRMTGGGDLKLMAAIGTFLGAKLTFFSFLIYIFAALVWAIMYSSFASHKKSGNPPFSRYWAMIRTLVTLGQITYLPPSPNEFMGQRVPMAPAIALGALAAPLIFI